MKLADKLELTQADREMLVKSLITTLSEYNIKRFDLLKSISMCYDACILGVKLEKWLATVDDDESDIEDDE